MPLKDTVHVTGAAQLSRQLAALEQQVAGKALRGAALSATLPTLRHAQATIPVGRVPHTTYKGRLVAPGFARRSLRRATRLTHRGTRVSVRIGVRREAFYAVQFLELGTSKMPKQPWLVPAYNATYRTVTARLSGELKKRIQRAARR